ncbi:sigma factor [Streptomyces sp. M19]
MGVDGREEPRGGSEREPGTGAGGTERSRPGSAPENPGPASEKAGPRRRRRRAPGRRDPRCRARAGAIAPAGIRGRVVRVGIRGRVVRVGGRVGDRLTFERAPAAPPGQERRGGRGCRSRGRGSGRRDRAAGDGGARPGDRGTQAGASGPSDADLLARLRNGEDSAYEELYRRHAGAVRRYARTCCRDADTADDLTAEVFARTLQAVRAARAPSRPYARTC